MELEKNRLIDSYKRRLDYLRISITDRCNLNCLYCNPLSTETKLLHKEILRYEEILRIARIGVHLGITKIRVTGGEPLARKGCCDFLQQLGEIDGLKDISLTTNGVLLNEHIDGIHAAGVKRLNISLDSLNRDKYHQITGHDVFDRVWANIQLALARGFSPIKLNMVVQSGINDDEIRELARLSLNHPLHVRFIEQMPIGKPPAKTAPPVLVPAIRACVESLGELIPVTKAATDGPADRYRLRGGKGEIGFISPVSNHFCSRCNRLRLTSDGRLLTCLLSDISEDIKTPLRRGLLDNDLAAVFLRAVGRKPFSHPEALMPSQQPEQMVSIGG
ncbi:MAG: GTP 3',8-cyclase MoaA [Desulfobacteraceae bacterium]|nr:MAG: GTP 3',8-cyclase MoaA [Desulfobacteraceae bacterium]